MTERLSSSSPIPIATKSLLSHLHCYNSLSPSFHSCLPTVCSSPSGQRGRGSFPSLPILSFLYFPILSWIRFFFFFPQSHYMGQRKVGACVSAESSYGPEWSQGLKGGCLFIKTAWLEESEPKGMIRYPRKRHIRAFERWTRCPSGIGSNFI